MPSLVYLFTGTGKGKTSAALGMSLRAVCAGMKVAWVAWYKESSWDVSEFGATKYLPNFEMYVMGKGFYFQKPTEDVKTVGKVRVAKTQIGVVVDAHHAEDHKEAAKLAMQKAIELVEKQEIDLLVCDELAQALAQGLVSEKDIDTLLARRGKIHLVITGRDAPQVLIDLADTVSEIKPIKHAYDRGIMAVKGLDF